MKATGDVASAHSVRCSERNARAAVDDCANSIGERRVGHRKRKGEKNRGLCYNRANCLKGA